jgi:hypothetical protein
MRFIHATPTENSFFCSYAKNFFENSKGLGNLITQSNKMKFTRHCLLLAFILTSGSVLQAQTADEIIAKYLDAIGGTEKLKGVSSVRMELSIDVMGNASSGVLTVLNGKGYRNESEFNGDKIIEVATDKSGWILNPFAGMADPGPMPETQYKASVNRIYAVPLLGYAARGDKAELVGQEKIGEVNAYKIKVTGKDNSVTTHYFDPTTYYLIQSVNSTEFGGQTIEMKVSYSDQKKTDYGWVIPYTSTLDFGGQFSLTTKVTKVDVNTTVDPAIFEMKK